MNDLTTIIVASVILVLPEALIWYFLPFWYAWALGLIFGILWTHGILFLFNRDEELQRTRGFYAGVFGVLNLLSVFLYHPTTGLSFSIGGFLSFTGVIIVGFSGFYRANIRMNESELEKEKEEEENKEWEDKKW